MPTRATVVFPCDLQPGDEVFDPATKRFVRVAELASGDRCVLVGTTAGSTVMLPASRRVRVHRDTEHATDDAFPLDVAPVRDALDERLHGWYPGDVVAARSAHQQHLAVDHARAARAAHVDDSVPPEVEEHLLAWYAGDLDQVRDLYAG